MNMTYILSLEKLTGRQLSAYELFQLLQHKLQHNIVNINVKEVEQLEQVLADYKLEWFRRYAPAFSGEAMKGLSTLSPGGSDMRAEIQLGMAALATTGE